MKIKYTIGIIVALLVAFVTGQSFYHYHKGNNAAITAPVYFKGYTNHAALCAVYYDPADSVKDITALKGWGNYKWKISGASDSVQFYFNQGISMYYAFHTIEAIASFTKATHLDPSCAMAWYGKALAMGPTINYPNGYRPPSEALQAATRSKELSVNCTSMEKSLINAMQQRYSADTTISIKQLRTNYAGAMQRVYAGYGKNADVVTLYADALMLLHPWDLYAHDFTPKPWTPQIRTLLEQAIAISPKHPGANHYYIHTMEASATPEVANNSAHLLDTLMPGVSHLTHMPSHIYIRTGDYARGIKDNNAALAGYDNYAKQYAPVIHGVVLYQYHNMHLMINCAQMGGNYKTAIDAAEKLQSLLSWKYLSSGDAGSNFMQYLYIQPIITNLRFGKWDDILKVKSVGNLSYASIYLHFARGLAYCAKGNVALANRELTALEEKMTDKSLKFSEDNFSPAYESAIVAQLILRGKIAGAQKQYAAAINLLQDAVKAEDHIIYNEPRDWPLPARQYLGDMLIIAGRNSEAIAVLNKDLTINPNNGWALSGLERAFANTNNTDALKKTQLRLKNAWKIKDLEINRPVF
ncbi:tetratricopeptide repeat protein [Mucilaginibacter sp. X4EP1]|uniref:tetratricopeptide repeat protein n=1 Tax=Mucilaginibacter sp. X4EP1 TaxID=2723092 RepID=UPI00216909E3|nr:hypothetical protein [Mucilaginibacter sp. X4EP1]MCS3811534.1 tetratricopeptide (TPR) repeat protein [Mucilaginibacter sp. X4EP1]